MGKAPRTPNPPKEKSAISSTLERKASKRESQFKFDNSAGSDHHCAMCSTPLSSDKAKKTCIGWHHMPCLKYHQTLLRVTSGADTCRSCALAREENDKRFRAIPLLILAISSRDEPATNGGTEPPPSARGLDFGKSAAERREDKKKRASLNRLSMFAIPPITYHEVGEILNTVLNPHANLEEFGANNPDLFEKNSRQLGIQRHAFKEGNFSYSDGSRLTLNPRNWCNITTGLRVDLTVVASADQRKALSELVVSIFAFVATTVQEEGETARRRNAFLRDRCSSGGRVEIERLHRKLAGESI